MQDIQWILSTTIQYWKTNAPCDIQQCCKRSGSDHDQVILNWCLWCARNSCMNQISVDLRELPFIIVLCPVSSLNKLQSKFWHLEAIPAKVFILAPSQDELRPSAGPRPLHLRHHQLLQRLAGRLEVVDEDRGSDGHVEEDQQDPHQPEVDLLTEPEEAEPQVDGHPVARLWQVALTLFGGHQGSESHPVPGQAAGSCGSNLDSLGYFIQRKSQVWCFLGSRLHPGSLALWFQLWRSPLSRVPPRPHRQLAPLGPSSMCTLETTFATGALVLPQERVWTGRSG